MEFETDSLSAKASPTATTRSPEASCLDKGRSRNEAEQPGSFLAGQDFALLGDPPDVARVFVNLADPRDETIEELDKLPGPSDPMAPGPLRS
nr:hypothetical protein Iba_chr09eCG10180 [Ipomoea batatas]